MNLFRPAVSRRVPSQSSFAELFLFPGPQEIAETGDNSYGTLFGSDWLLLIEAGTRVLMAFQRVNGAWVDRTGDPRMPPIVGTVLPEDVRRLSGAADQAARLVVAFEDGAGLVRVTRWDPGENSYVQNVTFSGRDPCVAMDASWAYRVPDSDVLLFYLSPDRTRVLCRVQRDVYGTEYELWDYGAPVILDRVIALPYKYQVLVSDATGSPLPDALISELYPVTVGGRLSLTAATATGGSYDLRVARHVVGASVGVLGAGPQGGGYFEPLLETNLAGSLAAFGVGPHSGVYAEALLKTSNSDALSIVVPGPHSGVFTPVVLATDYSSGVDISGAGPSGGTYA